MTDADAPAEEPSEERAPSEVFTDDVASEAAPTPRSSSEPDAPAEQPSSEPESPEDRLHGRDEQSVPQADAPGQQADAPTQPNQEANAAPDAQASGAEQTDESKQKSRSGDDQDATSEEIEKIWSILEDMED
ncbi:hypothetical protein [Salinibacter ruber]|uniref:hypothetical protein n=1 Tax=Salinibacter ruber TaxID=146919 RepID=UPI001F07E30F|nr:hypothetical protein [Salinibacter ruber]